MKKKPSAMLLEANFDIDQIGSTLEWKFSRSDGDGNPIHGRYAGGIYFTVGEKFFVRVQAGSKRPFTSFRVVDCILVSRPHIYICAPEKPTKFALPSLFVKGEGEVPYGASVNLASDKFVPRDVMKPDPDYYQKAQVWDDHLTIGDANGRWRLMFVLTVEIIDPASPEPIMRVFETDPESEVGNGSSPP